MSNYPEGVTGNEPEIAGGIPAEMVVTCEQGAVPCIPTHMLTAASAGLVNLHARYRKVLDKIGPPDTFTVPAASDKITLARLTTQLGQVVEILLDQITRNQQNLDYECTFDGEEVEGEIYGREFHWQCPECGTIQTTQLHNE